MTLLFSRVLEVVEVRGTCVHAKFHQAKLVQRFMNYRVDKLLFLSRNGEISENTFV